MGLLVDGGSYQWCDAKSTDRRFLREVITFMNWVTPDSAPLRPIAHPKSLAAALATSSPW